MFPLEGEFEDLPIDTFGKYISISPC